MFTGMIKEIGTVRKNEHSGGAYRIAIGCAAIGGRASVGDSIAVNGACLTVTAKRDGLLLFDAVPETARRTNIARLVPGDRVNLEDAIRAGEAIGGHFVSGHIDCVGTVRALRKRSDDIVLEVAFSPDFSALVVSKGSIAIDGVSLTIGDALADAVTAYLIPHTLRETTLGLKKAGDPVHLEFDIIGKYLLRNLQYGRTTTITDALLREKGFTL